MKKLLLYTQYNEKYNIRANLKPLSTEAILKKMEGVDPLELLRMSIINGDESGVDYALSKISSDTIWSTQIDKNMIMCVCINGNFNILKRISELDSSLINDCSSTIINTLLFYIHDNVLLNLFTEGILDKKYSNFAFSNALAFKIDISWFKKMLDYIDLDNSIISNIYCNDKQELMDYIGKTPRYRNKLSSYTIKKYF